MSKMSDLRALADDELEIRLAETKAELFNFRFQNVTGQLPNYTRLGQVKRDVARILTVLRQREIEAAESAQVHEGSR
jgi:large subunit ribosomal protein L29